MADKITNLKALEMALVILARDVNFPTEALEKVTNVKNSYAKKSDKDKKELTETQKENLVYKEKILELFNAHPTEKYTVTKVMKYLGLESNQKVTRLLSDLYAKGEGSIERDEDKRIARYFAKV